VRSSATFLSVVLGLLAVALSAAAPAVAQTAYVAGAGSNTVRPFDAETLAAASPIAIGAFTNEVAISPDGKDAYATDFAGGKIFKIDTATDAVVGTITAVPNPLGLVVSPDGGTLYVGDPDSSQSVYAISTTTGAAIGSPITLNNEAGSLALSPDGSTLYASEFHAQNVAVINTATRAFVTVGVGESPEGMALTPDGSRLYVTCEISNDVVVINTATKAVIGSPITGFSTPTAIAITPDGSTGYVVDSASGVTNNVTVISTATNTVVGTPISVSAQPVSAAVTADGRRLIVVTVEHGAAVVDTATGALIGERVPLGGEAEGVALVPAQTPLPSFTDSSAAPGTPVAFEAGASHAPDGQIARYDWDFGDGGHADDAGPTPSHVYAAAGTYTATLTVGNGQGCSGYLSTGGTPLCGGSSTASTTRQVVVVASGMNPGGGANPGGGSTPGGGSVARPLLPPKVRVACPSSAGGGAAASRCRSSPVARRRRRTERSRSPRPRPASAGSRWRRVARPWSP
jgi:YVTN family beta-propeller protein